MKGNRETVKHLIQKMFVTYCKSKDELVNDNKGIQERKNIDELNTHTIENLNRDLKNERKKNMSITKTFEQDVQNRYKENKILIDQITELRKQVLSLKFSNNLPTSSKGVQICVDTDMDLMNASEDDLKPRKNVEGVLPKLHKDSSKLLLPKQNSFKQNSVLTNNQTT